MRAKFLAALVAVLAAAAAAVVFFGGRPAGAETLNQTLDAFGFFGRWAINCGEPPSATNTVRSARISPAGEATFSESLGGTGEPNVYVILQATRSNAHTVVLRTRLNGAILQELTMLRHGDRLRTISNRDVATGRYVVRKSVVAATGQRTPWLTRCEQEPPGRRQTSL